MSVNKDSGIKKYRRVKRGSYFDEKTIVRHPMRYKTLFSQGMRMKKQGIPITKVIKEIERIAREQCDPPYVGKELDRLVHQIVVAYEEE